MVKVYLHLKHLPVHDEPKRSGKPLLRARTTRKEWWTPVVPKAGEFIDNGGVRYRVATVMHKLVQGGGSTILIFCDRLRKQPGEPS